jgi:hypothetical protein
MLFASASYDLLALLSVAIGWGVVSFRSSFLYAQRNDSIDSFNMIVVI